MLDIFGNSLTFKINNMEKIPTAKKLIRAQFCDGEFDEMMEYLNTSVESSIVDAMLEFARLHVEKALNEASKKSKIDIGKNYTVDEITLHPTSLIDTVVIKANVESILESYPLDNIK